MQKLPEISNRKRRRRMRKEKRTSRQKEEAHPLSLVTGEVTTLCKLVEDATHSSLDEALAGPFISSSPLG